MHPMIRLYGGMKIGCSHTTQRQLGSPCDFIVKMWVGCLELGFPNAYQNMLFSYGLSCSKSYLRKTRYCAGMCIEERTWIWCDVLFVVLNYDSHEHLFFECNYSRQVWRSRVFLAKISDLHLVSNQSIWFFSSCFVFSDWFRSLLGFKSINQPEN